MYKSLCDKLELIKTNKSASNGNDLLSSELNSFFLNKINENKLHKIYKFGGKIYIGNDTRESNKLLVSISLMAFTYTNSKIICLDEVTTPMIPWHIKKADSKDTFKSFLKDYYTNEIKAFQSLISKTSKDPITKKYFFDGANGVGHLIVQKMNQNGLNKLVSIEARNGPGDGPVNRNSGSDYILMHKTCPDNIDLGETGRGFACDGDGDRIILFYRNKKKEFRILNGDKILAFLCLGLKTLMNKHPIIKDLKLGAVATLYSDSNLQLYVESLGIPFFVEPTGVNNMFLKTKTLDLAFQVEFNGHACFFVSDKAKEVLLQSKETSELFSDLFSLNCSNGDFFSVFLLIQYFMRLTSMSFEQIDGLFVDKHTCLIQLKVSNKFAVVMDERTGVHHEPPDLGLFLENLMSKYKDDRLKIFIRKSGTEDIVRVMFESNTVEVIETTRPLVENFV